MSEPAAVYNSESFDLSSIATVPDTAAAMEVLHPHTGKVLTRSDGTAIAIQLLSIDSDRVSRYQADERNRVLGSARPQIMTAEREDTDTVDLLVVATESWNFDALDGKPFPYSAVNARKLYGDRRFRSVRQQALNFIYQRGNFIPR